MEIHCQDAYIQDKGSLNLLQPTWTTVSTLYQEVLKFVNQFPFKKRLIFCFVFRGTRVKIDLGDVKAAGVVCVLGIGFGLGTLLIYKLYYKYIRPILDQRDSQSNKSDPNSEDDICCFYVDDSDNENSKDMGNFISPTTPAVFYEPEIGVAICANHNVKRKKREEHVECGLNHSLRKQDVLIGVVEGVKFRNRKTRRCSSEEQSDKDSAIGGVSDLGQSFYSDSCINRDSFYSTCTAESGFENMADSFEDNNSVGCGYPIKFRYPSSTHSMNVNFSPKSLNDKHLRYLNDNPHEVSSDSINSFEVLEKSCVRTPLLDEKEKSPIHVGHKSSSHIYPEKLTCVSVDESERSQSLSADYDHLESLKSFSGTNSIGDWSCDDEGEGLSPLPHIRTSLSEYQFKQSVLQRLHEWSSLSDNYHSRSPTPDCLLGVRRSRSLDRNISDLYSVDGEFFENTAIDFEDDTTKNLEHIEDELHDIQDEFSVITSKLCDLIRRGSVSSEKSESESRTVSREIPLSPRNVLILQKAFSRWERSPSVSQDSNRCSREGSVDLAWDLCELSGSELPRRMRLIQHQRLSRDGSPLSVSGRNSNNNSNPDASVCELKDATTSADNSVDSSLPSDNLLVNSELAPDEVSHQSIGQATARLKNIGNVVNMLTYADNEWKGETATAERMKQGYSEVTSLFKCRSMRQIRGDNYCAIRSCLYQRLVSGINVTSQWSGIVDLINHLQKMYNDSTSGLARWNFANRLPCSSDKEKLSVICKCVLSLYATFEEICNFSTREEREKETVKLLNSEPTIDLELVEGVKILMLVHAMELYKANLAGQDVPVFVWLMFARDTSETVDKFVINHLNCVGDSGGLEQVEMCLLGHTLGTSIRVARLQNHGQEDFVCQFPDDADPTWPLIDLLAEDDRHYNIPVP